MATALNATEGVDSTLDCTHTRTFFSLSVSHFTHAHFKLKRVRVIFLVLSSISFLDVVAEQSSLYFPTSPFFTNRLKIQTFSVYYIHGKKLQEKPLRVRSLEWAEWQTQLQTQIFVQSTACSLIFRTSNTQRSVTRSPYHIATHTLAARPTRIDKHRPECAHFKSQRGCTWRDECVFKRRQSW